MRRRNFLLKAGLAALGGSLLPVAASAQEVAKPTSPKPRPLDSDIVAALEKLIPKLLQESGVPGLSIALVRDGGLRWRHGFGFKHSASKEPVDDDTVFEAASVSKTVFAYAVMKLSEQGLLELDAPLTRYTSKKFLEGDPRLDQITARRVLSHTTGFQDFRSRREPLKIHFTPGTKFLYSGEAYHYLQAVVTQLTGREDPADCSQYEAGFEVCATDFDPFMKRCLLEPFGMNSSGYVWRDFFEKHAASPHDITGKPLTKARPKPTDAARYGSCGGLHTTAGDYAKFLTEVIAPRPSDGFRLNAGSLREMLRPQVKLGEGEKIDGADSWALGWAVQERKTGPVIVHSGGQTGFRSLTMASVERKSGFVVLTNSDNGAKVFYHPDFIELTDRLLLGG